jgi:hypothetical protein
VLEQNEKEIVLKLTRVNSALEKALMESGLRVENTS